MNFSRRLQFLSELHQSETNIWDIGCDHGLLGLSFVQRLDIESVHLVDPSLDVINALQVKLLDSDIPKKEKISIHQKKGEEIKICSSQNLIFIAGMGGKNIIDILKHLSNQIDRSSKVVISPHKNILETRNYLHDSEWRLMSEHLVQENSQFYQVMSLKNEDSLPRVSRYGAEIWQNNLGKEYKNHLLKHLRTHRDEKSKQYVQFLEQI